MPAHRVLATLAVVAALVTSVVVVQLTASLPAYADGSATLSLTNVADMETDAAHGHLFLSGGSTSDTIVVTDFDGKVVDSITGLAGPSGMAIGGSTLFVVLSNAGTIAKIDTDTLDVIGSIDTGKASPRDLILAGTNLVFSFGACAQSSSALGVIPVSGGTTKVMAASTYCTGALAANPANPNQFAAGELGISPLTIFFYDLSVSTTTWVRAGGDGSNLADIAFSNDGTRLYSASGAPYVINSYLASDLSLSAPYVADAYPVAVEASPDGKTLAGGIDGAYDPDLYVFSLATGVQSMPPVEVAGSSNASLLDRGLKYSPDGKKLFAVSQGDYPSPGPVKLSVIDVCTIGGGPNNDALTGTPGDDVICGNGGDDVIDGGGGNDVIVGGPGNDMVAFPDASAVDVDLGAGTAAGEGADTLKTIEGVVGTPGNDSITGDAGPNRIVGGGGDDDLDGGGGEDVIAFPGNHAVTVDLVAGTASGAGADTIAHFEDVEGSARNDRISGDSGPNRLDGVLGNDTLTGGAGSDFVLGGNGDDRLLPGDDTDLDYIVGGDGVDTLSYALGGHGVTANLSTGLVSGAGNDTVQLVENIIGSAAADKITGTDGDNVINGGPGSDTLIGLGGADQLTGAGGNDGLSGMGGDDTLDGGPGTDRCLQGSGTGPQTACELTTLTVAAADITLPEGDSGTTNTNLQLSLILPTDAPVTVDFTLANGSATTPSDWTGPASGQFTFAPGQQVASIPVSIVGDSDIESNESFWLLLGNANGADVTDAVGRVTIQDDDKPGVSVTNAAILEGDSGTSLLHFSVVLSEAATAKVKISGNTVDGTATSGSDYTATSFSITIPVGATAAVVDVPVIGDTDAEANETLSLNITSAINGVVTDGSGLGTIINDDGAA